MKTAHSRLEDIKQNGFNLDFGTAFNDAFEVYKKMALMSGLAILLFGFVAAGLYMAILFSAFDMKNYTTFVMDIAADRLSVVNQLLYILAMSVGSALITPFNGSLVKMARQADLGEDVNFGDAFTCYKAPYFGQLFLLGFLVSIFSIALTTGLQKLVGPMPLVNAGISSLFTFLMVMATPLIALGNLKVTEAIPGSIVIVFKGFFVILGLLIVAFLLSLVGFIGFCIGIFFTLPFLYAMYYSIYKHTVGVEDESEIDEIGSADSF